MGLLDFAFPRRRVVVPAGAQVVIVVMAIMDRLVTPRVGVSRGERSESPYYAERSAPSLGEVERNMLWDVTNVLVGGDVYFGCRNRVF